MEFSKHKTCIHVWLTFLGHSTSYFGYSDLENKKKIFNRSVQRIPGCQTTAQFHNFTHIYIITMANCEASCIKKVVGTKGLMRMRQKV